MIEIKWIVSICNCLFPQVLISAAPAPSFSYKGQNHLINKDIRCKDDVFSHLYTLILTTDNKNEVIVDNEKVEYGSLDEDWDFLKTIKDPKATKPEADLKPEDWEHPNTSPTKTPWNPKIRMTRWTEKLENGPSCEEINF